MTDYERNKILELMEACNSEKVSILVVIHPWVFNQGLHCVQRARVLKCLRTNNHWQPRDCVRITGLSRRHIGRLFNKAKRKTNEQGNSDSNGHSYRNIHGNSSNGALAVV